VPDQSALRPGVFLDRDGTVAEEVGYLNHASRFRIFLFAAAARRSGCDDRCGPLLPAPFDGEL